MTNVNVEEFSQDKLLFSKKREGRRTQEGLVKRELGFNPG